MSTYGASKLAGEALLASYASMFGLTVRAFRFGNVVGPHQTHGVGFDFVRRLLRRPGRRCASSATAGRASPTSTSRTSSPPCCWPLRAPEPPFEAFNVATGDYITVTEIADLAAEVVGLAPGTTRFEYTGGDRGWKGDVPVVRINTDRIRALGWSNQRSGLEALRDSMASMLGDARDGRFDQ